MGVAIRAEEILERARVGDRSITADERRLAIQYVRGRQPNVTQRDLAQMFGVSDSLIRKDISKLVQDATEETRATYKDTVVGELINEQHIIYNGLKKSLEQAKLGSNTYVNHLTAMHKVRMDTVRILQEVGALPKSLEETTRKKEVFRAELQESTKQIVTRPIDLFDDIEDGESLQDSLKRKEHHDILEMEFAGTQAALPAPKEINGQNSDEEESGDSTAGEE